MLTKGLIVASAGRTRNDDGADLIVAGQRAGVGSRRAQEPAPTTPIAWIVLGLLIEKPSWKYEVYKRFERRYHDLQPITTSRIYATFDKLEHDGLIEAMDAETESILPVGTRREPGTPYRATARGATVWKRDLIGRFEEESQRPALLSRVLAASTLDDGLLGAVLDDLEEHLLDQRGAPIPSALTPVGEPGLIFGTRVVAEYQRSMLHAQLMFLDWAREQLKSRKVARATSHRGDDATHA